MVLASRFWFSILRWSVSGKPHRCYIFCFWSISYISLVFPHELYEYCTVRIGQRKSNRVTCFAFGRAFSPSCVSAQCLSGPHLYRTYQPDSVINYQLSVPYLCYSKSLSLDLASYQQPKARKSPCITIGPAPWRSLLSGSSTLRVPQAQGWSLDKDDIDNATPRISGTAAMQTCKEDVGCAGYGYSIWQGG